MNKLNAIQKRGKLNDIYEVGGTHHKYIICKSGENPCCDDVDNVYAAIQFQNGARKEENSTHGVIDSDLLEIVRHRLYHFQTGACSSKENEHALNHIEGALMWLNRRVEDRIERNVLGEDIK